MTRTVAYITNVHPFYLKMLLTSVGMLRTHNKTIPVRVFLIHDQTTQTIERENVWKHVSVDGETVRSFTDICAKLDVEVLDREPLILPGEETFFHINRKYFSDLKEPDVLYLDADTFVFGDVEIVFDHYQHVDFAACKADWAFPRGWSYDFLSKPVGPFSSGVMVWNNGTIRDWCDLLPRYLVKFRKNDTPLANWLYSQHPDCLLREEFSVTKHISESKLSHSFIEGEDCHLIRNEQCIESVGRSTIFHTYTPNWKKTYNKLFG